MADHTLPTAQKVSTSALSGLLETAMGKKAFQRSQRQKPQTSSEQHETARYRSSFGLGEKAEAALPV